MTEFDLSNLSHDIHQEARDAICDVILSWARLDSLVSQLALLAFGLAIDGGTILLGSMDTKSKLDRLKKLYNHHGMPAAAESIRALREWHTQFVDCRNTIAHHTCAGTWKSDPNWLVFAPVRAVQGQLDTMEIQHIPLSHLREAAKFATEAGNNLLDVTEQLTARSAVQPLEPPLFQPPNHSGPRKNGGRWTTPGLG